MTGNSAGGTSLCQVFDVETDIQIVHLLTQLAQGVVAIAHRILVINARQHLNQRRVILNMLFKLRQHRHGLLPSFSWLSAGVNKNRMELRSHFSGTMPFSRR